MNTNERMARVLQQIAINTQKHDAARIRHYMMSVLNDYEYEDNKTRWA